MTTDKPKIRLELRRGDRYAILAWPDNTRLAIATPDKPDWENTLRVMVEVALKSAWLGRARREMGLIQDDALKHMQAEIYKVLYARDSQLHNLRPDLYRTG